MMGGQGKSKGTLSGKGVSHGRPENQDWHDLHMIGAVCVCVSVTKVTHGRPD